MKTLQLILRYNLILILIILVSPSFGQDKPAETGITEEIEVVRPYKPVLADAVKIRRNPNMNETIPFKPQLSYIIPDKRLDLNTDLRQLQAQPPAAKPNMILRNNYLKIGAGNMNSGLGELYINTGNDEALQAGFFLKHLSQKGSINKQQYSSQQAGIFGRSILDQVTMNGELAYDRRSTFFYGFNPDDPAFNPDPRKQRFDLIKLNGEVLKNIANDDGLNYAVKGDMYFLKSLTESKENSIAFSGFLNKAVSRLNFGVNASADFTGTKDSLNSIGNNILRANPYIRLEGEHYKLNIGVNLISEFGDVSRTNVFPSVSAEANIIPKYATIYAGITGDVLKTSLRDLSMENPYLNSTLTIKNAVEKANIYGGIKGNAGGGFGYKATAYYKTVTNLPLLVNSVNGLEKFDVIYDGGDSEIIGLEGEVSLIASEAFSWTGKLIINNYALATETSAWFKPEFQLASNAKISINNKLIIHGDLLLSGESDAKTYTFSPAPVENTVMVKSFVDLSAGAEYRFADKIGLYIQVNNILAAKYQQYLYYSRLGLNMLAGFNYSF